jgi:hypothetical protein
MATAGRRHEYSLVLSAGSRCQYPHDSRAISEQTVVIENGECRCEQGEFDILQENIRLLEELGGNPDVNGLGDINVMEAMKNNYNIDYTKLNESSGVSAAESAVRQLGQGHSVVVSIPPQNGAIGHSIAIKGAYTKLIRNMNGTITSNKGMHFRIFDPAKTQSIYKNANYLNRLLPAGNIFGVFRR